MLTVRQKKKIDVADGVTVTIRGMTAAEQAVFADAATTVDANGKRDESAVVRAGLVGVCGGEGFAIEKADSDEVAQVAYADVTGEWLWENAPLDVAAEVCSQIVRLSKISPEEKKT